MKKRFVHFLLLSLLPLSLLADFSSSQLTPHPLFPGKDPFIIEITGTWPTDCHPGEQKPVLDAYDGMSAEISFETIIEHVTCNTEDTPYRVLIDMSEAVRAGEAIEDMLEITITFQGKKLEQVLPLVCPEEIDCSGMLSNRQLAEPGLYFSAGLAKQGLLVARQNEAMAIYPLVYDAEGSSEWLFTGTTMSEDTFFTELLRFSGGDCFGCEPSDTRPIMSVAGQLSVLVDRPGLLQVKIDDGLFVPYDSLVYGYETVEVGTSDKKTITDMAGRWAISENLGDLTDFFPGTFDIELEKTDPEAEDAPPAGQVSYLVSALSGQVLGQLICKGQTGEDGADQCEFIDPTDAADPLFLFYQHGPTRLAIEYGRAVEAEAVAPSGSAVRLD